jgi:hypothetical protein
MLPEALVPRIGGATTAIPNFFSCARLTSPAGSPRNRA